ncbi:hypothetical protein [Brevundimonas sp.]|uniref:hypothetical protein n=1 Tax=Brevundimonas sp. TaxID=1871086 RepID=UPI002AB83B6C|nr:hypothetical protein [Brevundimonas sp.]MDZ4364152.1 hypothetical protein [Brevundimonas sp.]
MTARRLAIAASALLMLGTPASAQDSNNPIPGIDVVVRKQPGGGALVVGQTGRDGWLRAPIRVEPGQYQVTGACPVRRTCPAFRLALVRVEGRVIAPDARGRFVFPVGSTTGQVRLEVNTILQEVSTTR